jgi:hypothetical protein
MRPRLSFANVVATIALFIALGGASYAAIKVPKNSVGSKQLKKNAVGTKQLKLNAVGTEQLQNDAVVGVKVADRSLGAADIAGPVDSATNAASAANSDRLDGLDSTAFQLAPKVKIDNADAIAGDLVDFSPDVSGLSVLVLNYTVPTVMDVLGEPSFPGGVEGQRLTIVAGKQAIIMTNVEDRKLAGGVWSGEKGDTLSLVLADGIWYEAGRSKNH